MIARLRSALDVSLRTKLGAITTVTLALALGLVYAILSQNERRTYEALLARDLPTLARETEYNCRAPLAFGDRKSAEATLSALREDERIVAAVLFGNDGAAFATYRRTGFSGALPARAPAGEGVEQQPGQVRVVRRVALEGEPLGTLYIASDLHDVDEMLERFAGLMLLVMLGSSGLALVLSSGLQRGILDKVQRLSRAAHAVTLEHDYAVRVEGDGRDELGRLIEAVNAMLHQIQLRDAELEAQARELARSNADLEQFAYVASHDLQEPLRVINSYTQLLGSRYTELFDERARKYMEFVTDSATHMQQLIEDLLAYSRLGRDWQPTDVRADEALDQALRNLRASLDEAHAQVEREPLPVVRANATYLTQLFQNLLSNAIKFRAEAAPVIQVGAVRTAEGWQFHVKDNGIGIAGDYHQKIFALFKRLHPRSRYPGTGIGLGFCQKIVKLHGGRMWLSSAAGEGSTFYFTIPEAR